jgi:3-hydroxyisobutyrate dehydrogenase-like beta-hydroxyacid dehydrogenase
MTKVGFLGFGEAGSLIAGALGDAGLTSMVAYDIAWKTSDLVRDRAAEMGVDLLAHPSDLAKESDTIISAVVCTEAVDAACSVIDDLTNDHLYLDINSVSPRTKSDIGGRFSQLNLRYLDVAVMGNVKRDLASVPLLLAGRDAEEARHRLAAAGLDMSIVSPTVGDAAQVKMFRSLFVKGLEALALEGMMASYAAGAHDQVLASLQDTFGKYTFSGLIQHLIERHAVHGRRRADELREVSASLRDVGIDPIMAEAGAKRMSWDVERGFQDRYAKGTDPGWREVLEGLSELMAEEEDRDV